MSELSPLAELEENIRQLSYEQLLLIERVSRRMRTDISGKTDIDAQLSRMATDPEIQKELQKIGREFSATEQDGLDD